MEALKEKEAPHCKPYDTFKCCIQSTSLELPVGQRIKRYEKDFSTPREALSQAEVILFCYPVYTFLVPYQLHRFLELLRQMEWTFRERLPLKLPRPSIFTM